MTTKSEELRQELISDDDRRKAEIQDETLAALKRYEDGYMNRMALEVTLMGIGWPERHIKKLLGLAAVGQQEENTRQTRKG